REKVKEKAMAKRFNSIQLVEPDGLPVMEVGNWAQKKYKLVGKYCDIFTSGMRNKWNLVYLDLFCGPGYVKNKTSGQLMKNSGLLAVSLPHRFDYYLYNDKKTQYTEAIKSRVGAELSENSFRVFNQDANSVVQSMLDSIPRFNNGKGTLIFAFLDPFSLNLDFETVRLLGNNQVDILVLHALQVDARRNHSKYKSSDSLVVAKFTGNQDWRQIFEKHEQTPTGFMRFVTEEFDKSIRGIGYRCAPIKEKINNNNGSGIYYLCFYSKHERGLEFFEKIRKTGNDQYELF
ncbi:MAG TPA: three-Cys-motif partner protein TcmP, partial [Marinilabiliaceae bacterium]|nr:three-Cys-motif partner protein TcmP [Marinilabiliaceae bacterium]